MAAQKAKKEYVGTTLIVGRKTYMIPETLSSQLALIIKEFAPHILEENAPRKRKPSEEGDS